MFTRSALIATAWGVFSISPLASADLPTQYLPINGGSGGSGYTRNCGADKALTGFVYRSGMVIDAVGIQCRGVTSSGTLGTQSTVGSLVGGGGGTSRSLSCDANQVVTALHVFYGSWISEFAIECQPWNPSTRTFSGTKTYKSAGSHSFSDHAAATRCESSAQPVVGIRGRAANVVDAMGIFCDEP